MRGPEQGPTEKDEEDDVASRRLTPSANLRPRVELASDSDLPSDTSNEDFLFHLYRGSELLQDNRAHEAKEELERALHLQPHDTKGQDLLAVVYFRLGHYPRAIAIYEQLRRKSPRDPALLLNLALCYLKTGQAELARTALTQLVEVNPSHSRAWGYLGLACERTGDLELAERAFEQGGHAAMAKRIAQRRAAAAPVVREVSSARMVSPHEGGKPSAEIRDVAGAAFEELDAGELDFSVAEQAPEEAVDPEAPAENWRSIELGRLINPRHPYQPGDPISSGSGNPPSSNKGERPESAKPDTKDGPPIQSPPVPKVAPHPAPPPSASGGGNRGPERRPTLIVGVPPAHEQADLERMGGRFPSPRPPTFTLDDAGTPSLARRGPVVAVPPVRVPSIALREAAGISDIPSDPGRELQPAPGKRTLPPPAHPPSAPPPPASQLTDVSSVNFPEAGRVLIHSSGVALVRTAAEAGFSARLESIRVSSNGLAMKLLERHAKGKPTGESFGGVGSPVVHATGEGQLVLAPRPGRKLSSFALEDEMCFVREEVLLGFNDELVFENGRLATGEGEFVAVVQLRGKGAVILEGIGEILTLDVQSTRGLSVRREVVLGWFGRLVPRALAAAEAPCGQRGLVSFAGEGRVLVASA